LNTLSKRSKEWLSSDYETHERGESYTSDSRWIPPSWGSLALDPLPLVESFARQMTIESAARKLFYQLPQERDLQGLDALLFSQRVNLKINKTKALNKLDKVIWTFSFLDLCLSPNRSKSTFCIHSVRVRVAHNASLSGNWPK